MVGSCRLVVAAAFALLLTAAQSALAGLSCGLPVSAGPSPKASDALAALKTSVGGEQCGELELQCRCDIDASGAITASDALRILRAAVENDEIDACACNLDGYPCSAFQISIASASTMDWGWTGTAHDVQLSEMPLMSLAVVKRCSVDGESCDTDSDCDGGACATTCDCALDTECELAGPVDQKRCLTTLAECDTNADCAAGVACVSMFSPPMPISTAGNPICLVNVASTGFTGTTDLVAGEFSLSGSILARISLGIAIDQPCPRCGPPESNPRIGDPFICEGGQRPGKDCTVDAVGMFGGTSFDCPPNLAAGTMGPGLAIPLRNFGTSRIEKTAALPCASFPFLGHPSRGNAKCTDRVGLDDPPCSSNADCLRCMDDLNVSCASNADCGGSGTCAEAPAQPVTCGFWCHCGFCNDVGTKPCLDDGDCGPGESCVAGTGSGIAANAPQRQPNDCISDKFLCGTDVADRCENTLNGRCELDPFRSCTTDDLCLQFDAGQCRFEQRSCFESTIVRRGEPSPRDSYCRQGLVPCAGDADCGEGDACRPGSMVPTLAALTCSGAFSSSTINSATGITGPMALDLKTFITTCYCGDGDLGCGEQCDDSNHSSGDGCDENCRTEIVELHP